MKRLFLFLLLTLMPLQILGCVSQDLGSFNEEKENLNNEILRLETIISEQEEKIDQLKRLNSKKNNEIDKLEESKRMLRNSAYARLDDYDNSFYNLEKVYKISSNYEIKDDWYLIGEDFFQIELLGYEDARKVELYALRLESDQEPILLYKNEEAGSRWIYSHDNIGEVIDKQEKPLPSRRNFSYEPYFVIHGRVTLDNGRIIKTGKLPIYNQ